MCETFFGPILAWSVMIFFGTVLVAGVAFGVTLPVALISKLAKDARKQKDDFDQWLMTIGITVVCWALIVPGLLLLLEAMCMEPLC